MQVPLKTAKEKITKIFYDMFSKEKVVSVRVIPKLDDLYTRAEKLKEYRNKLAYYQDEKQKTGVRPRIKRGGCCGCGKIWVDALDYFNMYI